MLPIAAAMLALTGALALACFAKAFGLSFLAQPRSPQARRAKEVPWSMRAGMGFLAGACVVLGLAPMLVIPLLDRVTALLTGVSISVQVLALDGWVVAPVTVEFSSISTPVLAVLLVGAGGLGVLIARLCGKGLRARYYKTWGCGLNLTPRMEYSAMGFAQPIKQVFETIYQPAVKLEREFLEQSKYFIKHQRFESHIHPMFETYLYEPVVRRLLALADRLRVIQAGSLHVYLSYIFLTLVLLLLWAG